MSLADINILITLLVTLSALLGVSWSASKKLTKIEIQLELLTNLSVDRLERKEFERFVRHLAQLNPTLNIPEVD